MKKLIHNILREQLNPIKWVKPHFEDEEDEFMNHFLNWYEDNIIKVNFDLISDEEYHQHVSDIEWAYLNTKIEVLTDEEWVHMENTDSCGLENEEDIYNIIGGYGRSKERLLYDAKLFGFANILEETWSCWFPNDGKPCKKCPMCRERIVSHPEPTPDL